MDRPVPEEKWADTTPRVRFQDGEALGDRRDRAEPRGYHAGPCRDPQRLWPQPGFCPRPVRPREIPVGERKEAYGALRKSEKES